MESSLYRNMISEDALDRPLTFAALLTMMRHRGKIILLWLAAAVIGCLFYYALQKPEYESSAKVLVNHVDDYEKQIGAPGGRSSYDPVSTEISLIKSRSTLEKVVEEIDLGSGKKQRDGADDKTRQVERLLRELKVEREKDTNVLVITFRADDPYTAKEVVDCVIRQYQQQRPRLSRDERAFEFFDRQITKLKSTIDSLEYNGLQFRNAEEVLLPDRQSEILFASMADFDRELTRVRAQRIARESRLRALQEQGQAGNESAVVSLSDGEWSPADHLNQLRQNLLQLQNRRNTLRLKYTDKHPEVQAVLQDIQATETEIQRQIASMIEAEQTAVRMLKAQESELTRSMSELAGKISDLSRKEYELGRRTIGIEELKQVYAALLRHREEARLAANKKEYLVQVQVVDWGNLPTTPCGRSIVVLLVLSVGIGLLIGMVWVVAVEHFDRSIYSVDDAEAATGLTLIAVVSDDPRIAALHPPTKRPLAEPATKVYQ
ncbi:MAG: Wzz/FepE/Etk N-terminal domain-containing protein [candidate division KSB1 bacterium]|nr:Wzz/FepE/Etk N-terminal domain-containing protein [candidate division KSB1 bacterium]